MKGLVRLLLLSCLIPGINAEVKADNWQKIRIIDRGLNMSLGQLIVPGGWKVRQDIVTNLQTSQYDRFLLDAQGPDNSLIRGMGTATYSHIAGTNFDSVVEAMALAGVQGVEGLTYGEFTINQRALSRSKFQQAAKQAQSKGIQLEPLHLRFQGTVSGQKIEGRLEVLHVPFIDGGQHIGGQVTVALLMSLPENIESLIRISDEISDRFQANPKYDSARSQLINRITAQRSVEHQQRMLQNQAQFNAHQSMMKSRYESAYKQNDKWLQNFRSSGNNTSGNVDYSGHDKTIDSINETTSFFDESTGSRVTQDGQYDYWATDGQGNYVGSDDPNFDPNALEGNWQAVVPLN